MRIFASFQKGTDAVSEVVWKGTEQKENTTYVSFSSYCVIMFWRYTVTVCLSLSLCKDRLELVRPLRARLTLRQWGAEKSWGTWNTEGTTSSVENPSAVNYQGLLRRKGIALLTPFFNIHLVGTGLDRADLAQTFLCLHGWTNWTAYSILRLYKWRRSALALSSALPYTLTFSKLTAFILGWAIVGLACTCS